MTRRPPTPRITQAELRALRWCEKFAAYRIDFDDLRWQNIAAARRALDKLSRPPKPPRRRGKS